MPEATRWSLIVHGGAKTIDPALHDRNRAGCTAAAEAGAAVLRAGGSAVFAAEVAVRVLEDDPVFNAGFGSVLTSDGTVEMDAAMMEGSGLTLGAVAGVRRVRNPVSVARLMLPARPVLLAGDGAERFATDHGMALVDPETMISREALAFEHAKAHDTVGCVAIDATGAIAAATSTGGLPGKLVLQYGDQDLPDPGIPDVEIRRTIPFDDLQLLLRDADMVICHGGTGSLVTALRAGCRVVAFPRRHDLGEHYDDHQEEIAQTFADRGLLQAVRDERQLGAAVEAAKATEPQLATTDHTALAARLRELLAQWSAKR